MLESLPGLFLMAMITLTLILLPYMNDDRSQEPRRATEEIRLNVKRGRDT